MTFHNNQAPLHIAFYCNLMGWPKCSSGGVRQWVLTMANALVEAGHRVEVLSEAPDKHVMDEPLLDARVGRVVLGKWPVAGFRLRRYVREHPGVRIVAALNYYNIRAAKLKRRYGGQVHVMLTQRENLSADAVWRKALKYRYTIHAVRRYFSDADAVVTVSDGLKVDLRDQFGIDAARLHTIYNPAYRHGFLEAANAPVAHPWLNEPRRPLIIASGRLHFVKGFDDLLRAFARMPAALAARLIILGEGKERPALEALVAELGLQDSVALPGRQPSIAPWMAQADLFVLSSRREGLPAVLIEALASGLPVVSTRCPSGPDEILQAGRLGTLVEVGDIDGMADAMVNALQAGEVDRDALRARAAEFSLERALPQYLELWRQPAREHGHKRRR